MNDQQDYRLSTLVMAVARAEAGLDLAFEIAQPRRSSVADLQRSPPSSCLRRTPSCSDRACAAAMELRKRSGGWDRRRRDHVRQRSLCERYFMITPPNGPVKSDTRIWAEGYTQHELDLAQETFGLTFPPDLIAFFLERRPVQGYDWRFDAERIRRMLAAPLRGLIFDVENSDLWWPEWGDRPATAEARADVVREVVNQAPKLVPLVYHRYLPCEPNESGNPVFSIHQSDVIYYGANIADYFEREFVSDRGPIVGPIKQIRFWSELADRY
jgi:hypothetical protein